MSKSMSEKAAMNVLSIVHDFHRRTPSDYESMSKGIDIMKTIFNIILCLIVAIMFWSFMADYPVVTLILGVGFFIVNRMAYSVNLVYTVKKVYESENLAFIRHNVAKESKEESAFEQEVRHIVKTYLTEKAKITKELLDKVS